MHYLEFLRRLHDELRPAGYLEIGVDWGDSLQLSRARSVAIDPAPKPRPESMLGKPGLILYAGTSDEFFREQRREAMLGDTPLDLAFIDGLHEFAQVVRDLEHVEGWSHAGTVVAIHDVLPRNAWEATSAFHDGFWTGDVWRVVPFLRQRRPDLRLLLVAAEPTGMLIVTGLNPAASGMADLAAAKDASFPEPGPEYDRLVNAYIAEAAAEPAEAVLRTLSLPRLPDREWAYDTKWGMRMAAAASWRPLLEVAAESAGTDHHDAGMRACLRLIGAYWLPEGVREQAYEQLAHHAKPMTALWPEATWSLLALPGDGNARLNGPGPATVDGALVATVQTLNAGDDGGSWTLLRLNDTLKVLMAEPLVDETHAAEFPGPGAFEHVQPFVQDGRLRALVTVSDRNPAGVAQTGLASVEAGALRDLRLLSDAANGRHERHWAPVATDAGLFAISWWEPTETWRVAESRDDREVVERVALWPAPRLAERWRGASPGVAVPGGWLVLVNERAGATDRVDAESFARFVFVDTDFRVTAVSPHFWVAARGQDVVSGLTRQGERLVAGLTSRGEEAVLVSLDLDAVLNALRRIESPVSDPAARGSPDRAPPISTGSRSEISEPMAL